MLKFMGHKSYSLLDYDMRNPVKSLLPFALTISDRNGSIWTENAVSVLASRSPKADS